MSAAVVWGNCQSEPLAGVLEAPLAAVGITLVKVPPVYLVTPEELDEVRRTVSRCTLLITQPVREGYRMAGTGYEELAALLPPSGRVVTWPVAFDSSEFPFQVIGHDTAGDGVFAPLTAYHDLRLMAASELGWDAAKVLEWWPGSTESAAIIEVSDRSLAEMRRREATLDVEVSSAMGRPGAMFTVNHPGNAVIAHMAEQVMAAIGHPVAIEVAAHEELDHTTTPLEPAVLAAHGWDPALARGWTVGREPLDLATVVDHHLAFYLDHPYVVADARTRYADQFAILGL